VGRGAGHRPVLPHREDDLGGLGELQRGLHDGARRHPDCDASGNCAGANAGSTCAAGETCQAGTCLQSRVPVALEVDGGRIGWQIPSGSTIYTDPFKQTMCVGILFETKVVFATFFAAGPEYVSGIQMLPSTPASENLVSPTWIGGAWPKMAAAWTEVNTLTAFDDGNSQTNAFWWVATRP
jgi:hypothetical protein